MKIVAGLGSIDEYELYANAGADEFFCGYVPYSWSKKYGTVLPLNRREVLCYHVQIGSFSELEILADMVEKYKKPVHFTFNSLYYLPEQYPEITEIIKKCMSLGFQSYIVADPALLVYLRENYVDCEIHLSGETGEINSQMTNAFSRFDLKRVIFHRKNTFADMKSVIENTSCISEFEAFVLNEKCQFTGAFCNSLHCDELGYLCRVPYKFGKIKREKDEENVSEKLTKERENTGGDVPREKGTKEDDTGYLCGETGCGLCALYSLEKAGITHLKLVGRGNYVGYMEKDIRNLRTALEVLKNVKNETEYIEKMKAEIFSNGCSKNCYYYSRRL